jgi:rare lipoprotein A
VQELVSGEKLSDSHTIIAQLIIRATEGTYFWKITAHLVIGDPHHALTRTVGGHHSDRTIDAGKHYQRRGVREEPLASLGQPKERSTEIGRPFEGSGIASVYSGQHTASGEHMNSGAMTAAHRTLPFGSKVTVVNGGNGRSAVVRINDRGPFVHGRVIDLSPAAARVLGIRGLTTVSLSTQPKAHRPGWLQRPRPL